MKATLSGTGAVPMRQSAMLRFATYFRRRVDDLREQWVRVYTADNPPEAVFIRGLLEAEGIPVRLKSMELWTAAVEIYFAEGARPSVWVPGNAREEAERVLAQRDRSNFGSPWTCRCGEQLGGQFTVCWRCAAPRTDRDTADS